ncbi:hypothetical protein DMP07_01290 [Slackia faecicanis]|uniref:Uncharacterized protein n=1 Tax=Slackia faecicanis TaxID=255723 RepID=A0A3N0AHG7_9ACTN|nr:hypothetical protein DMP07_01290 [Slackia faecicanis]
MYGDKSKKCTKFTVSRQVRISPGYFEAKRAARPSGWLSPNERDLLAHLDAQPNKAGHIKALIRADMERGE